MQGRHQNEADAGAGFARRKIFADDDGVTRHDAALEQTEQRRDHVERRETVEEQIEEQRAALQHRAEQQRAHAADAVGNEPRRDAADDAEAEHQRQHLGAARGAVAEVAAIGHQMHLRHRHRHATGDAGDAQQHLQRRGRERQFGLPARRRLPRGLGVMRLHAPPQQIDERQHADEQEQANAGMGRAPARRGDEMLHHRRPERAGEIIAGRRDGDGDAAPAHEPVRHVGHQRSEAGRTTDPDQQSMRGRHLPERGRLADRQIAEAERQGPERQRHGDPEAVGEPAHEHAAAGEAEHGERVGQRGIGAGDAEIGLDGGQGDHHRPHADPADGAEQHGDGQAQPGFRGIGRVRLGPACGGVRWNHGDDLPGY